jgi:hypothetical protein
MVGKLLNARFVERVDRLMIAVIDFTHVAVLAAVVLIAVLTLLAAIRTIRTKGASTADTASWLIVLLLLPVIGLVIWAITRSVSGFRSRTARL